MCKEKVEAEDQLCVNTKCEHNMLYDKLYLMHPNFHSLIGWAFLNCDHNLCVLNEMDAGIRLRYIGEMWGMTKQNVSLIEIQAMRKFAVNHKILTKEEEQYGEDQSQRPRNI